MLVIVTVSQSGVMGRVQRHTRGASPNFLKDFRVAPVENSAAIS